jgi:hypothetical protein
MENQSHITENTLCVNASVKSDEKKYYKEMDTARNTTETMMTKKTGAVCRSRGLCRVRAGLNLNLNFLFKVQ